MESSSALRLRKIALAKGLVHPASSIRNQMVYLSANGEVIGQFEERDLPSSLAAGKVPPDSFFWREGMPEWRPLRELVLPPRPVRVQPAPESPCASPSPSGHGQTGARPAAERAGTRPITPAIAQKKPFVPRPAAAESQQAPSPRADAAAKDAAMRKPEASAKPTALWNRLFRRSSGEPPKTAPAAAPSKPGQSAPTARSDSFAPVKPDAASSAPAVAAAPAADPVPLSPARSVRPPAASSAARAAKRIVLPPTRRSTHLPGELGAQSLLLPAKPTPTPSQDSPPQVQQLPAVAPPPHSLVSGRSSSGEPAVLGAQEASGKKKIPSAPTYDNAKKPSQGAAQSEAVTKSVGGLPGPSAPSPAQGQVSPDMHGQTAAPAAKLSPPQPWRAVAFAPGSEAVAARPPHRTPSPTPVAVGFGKQEGLPPAGEKTAPPESTAGAPAARPAAKPSEQPGSGPELMLAAAKARGRRGRKALLATLILILLAALGAAAWWFFPLQPPVLRGEVRLAADDGTSLPAAGADVYLVSRDELTARWRDQLAEAQSRGVEVEELLKQANSVHREKVLALELASRTSELADEYNMPDAAELRAARDAALAEEATALAEAEKLRREKESFTSAAALLKAPPDALDQTQTDESGAFTLTLPASTEGLAVFVLAGADGEDPSGVYGWLVPLAGPDEETKPALLSPANALDAEQIREIAGTQP